MGTIYFTARRIGRLVVTSQVIAAISLVRSLQRVQFGTGTVKRDYVIDLKASRFSTFDAPPTVTV